METMKSVEQTELLSDYASFESGSWTKSTSFICIGAVDQYLYLFGHSEL